MTDKPASPQSDLRPLSVKAVLGLSRKADLDWARLRGLQYSSIAQLTFLRAYANIVLALLVVQLFRDEFSIWALGGWVLAMSALHIRGAQFDRSLADTENRLITRAEFLRQTLTSLLSGCLWSVPILVFAPHGSFTDMTAVLVVTSLVVAGSIYFYTAAPLGICTLATVLGSSTVVYLAMNQMWVLATIMALYFFASMLGAIEVARTYLRARIAEQLVAEKEEVVSLLLREFEENEADWLWEVDPNRRLRGVSPRFAFALGGRQAEYEGKPLLEMITTANWDNGKFPTSQHDLAECLKNRENFSNLIVQVSIKGEERYWELSGSPMRDEQGKFIGFRGVGSDVTAARQSSEKIAYLARYDTLTSLPNRLQLTDALAEGLKFAEKWRTRCAFLMVDLDRFKSVNDSLGHAIGDQMLEQVSARLQALMNENQLCGRLGGDEFAIVIQDASDPEIIKRLARQVIATLSEPYQVNHHTLYVGASVGSAIGPRDGNTVEELMRNADLALYRAKDAGGGEHFRFEPVQHAVAEERRQLEASLRHALDNDEFMLHYQPVVDSQTEDIVSFEALVRWNSPDHGFVSPGKFIPLAEDTRLIVPIGKWVLIEACREAAGSWPEDIKVNVNVSPEQLVEPTFSQEVVEALAHTGLPAQRLELEVTESIFLRDANVARNALEQIMALGCSVALDDFGTGYSSLGYLRKLRFSTIKIDRTFVQGAAQNSSESLAIINAVVAMARSLDMATTAEGVEDEDQAKLIRNLGCDKIQGYYFGRPMSAADARKLFGDFDRASA